jgi:hypothetical protein
MACRVRKDYSNGLVENKAILKEGSDYFIVEVSLRVSSGFYPKHPNHAPWIGPMRLQEAKEQLSAVTAK